MREGEREERGSEGVGVKERGRERKGESERENVVVVWARK